jgi:hypothetical protein
VIVPRVDFLDDCQQLLDQRSSIASAASQRVTAIYDRMRANGASDILKLEETFNELRSHPGLTGDPLEIFGFYESLQRMMIYAEEFEQVKKPANGGELAENLFDSAIFQRAARLWESHNVQNLGDQYTMRRVFNERFHSAAAQGSTGWHCAFKRWAPDPSWGGRDEMPKEFVLFGVGPEDAEMSDDSFVIGITATLDHPWRSAEVHFHTHRGRGRLPALITEWRRICRLHNYL